MTLIVEDGSGLSSAQVIVSIADMDTYNAQMGNTTWAALSNSDKELAALRGVQFVELVFGGKLLGWKVNYLQGLSWPRYGVESFDGVILSSTPIPTKVKNGYTEAAFAASVDGDLIAAVSAGTTGIKKERIKVGPIEEEIEYTGSKSTAKAYPKIYSLFSEYIAASDRLDRTG